jgi:hypothetical protein
MTRKQDEPQQIYDDVWYVVAHGKPPYSLECCACGYVHRIDYKAENGQIFERYVVDEEESALARKRRGITKEVAAIAKKEREIERSKAKK